MGTTVESLQVENTKLKQRVEELESKFVSRLIYLAGPYGRNPLCPCDKCKTMYEKYYANDKENWHG